MGNYANLMWLPIINAVLTGGIIIARSAVTLAYVFRGEESDLHHDDSEYETQDFESSASAKKEEILGGLSSTRVRIFLVVHHFAFDFFVAILVVQMVFRIYTYQCLRRSTQQTSGTNFVAIAHFFGIAAFLAYFGYILVRNVIKTAEMPSIIYRILPVLICVFTSAYCIIQSYISYLDLSRQGLPVPVTDGANRQVVYTYMRLSSTGVIVLLATILSILSLIDNINLVIMRKLLGAVVCVFFLTYITLFKTIPCTRGHHQRTSNVNPVASAQVVPHVVNINHPAVNSAAVMSAQNAESTPQGLPQPPGYNELYGNQETPQQHIPMGPMGPPTWQNTQPGSNQPTWQNTPPGQNQSTWQDPPPGQNIAHGASFPAVDSYYANLERSNQVLEG